MSTGPAPLGDVKVIEVIVATLRLQGPKTQPSCKKKKKKMRASEMNNTYILV